MLFDDRIAQRCCVFDFKQLDFGLIATLFGTKELLRLLLLKLPQSAPFDFSFCRAMSDNRSMVYEHLMSKVKILQALNSTEAVQVMVSGDVVYDSVKMPNHTWLYLMHKDAKAFAEMMAKDPLLKDLFTAYTVVQGLQLMGACQQRVIDAESVFFAPWSRL